MKSNTATKTAKILTHEGAAVQTPTPYNELRRTVLNCLLFEDTFYESGTSIADRMAALVKTLPPLKVAELAIEARDKMYLRHVPLFLVRELARRSKESGVGSIVADTLESVVQRADELAEFLALYWKDGKQPLAAGVKRGLARAFTKFSEYNLAKYNRDAAIKLRDVMFLVHPSPLKGMKKTFKDLANKTLASPETWEVLLSAGKDKKKTFEKLLKEEKLGGLATLRNLRNMQEAGVSDKLIRERLEEGEFKKVLPFRFIAAARYAPTLEPSLEKAMFKATETLPEIPGKTGILIDVSGSMGGLLSAKSQMTRLDAASALAIYFREKSPEVQIATFSNGLVVVPPRRGFALRDAIYNSQDHSSTNLRASLVRLAKIPAWAKLDRLIIITDEQSHDGIMDAWTDTAYVINVCPYKPGISYGHGYQHIDGFSERILDYIVLSEAGD